MTARFKLKSPPSVQAVRVSANRSALPDLLTNLVGMGARSILLSFTSEGDVEDVAVSDAQMATLSTNSSVADTLDLSQALVGVGERAVVAEWWSSR